MYEPGPSRCLSLAKLSETIVSTLREYTGKLNDETFLWNHISNPEKTLFLRLSSYYTQKYKNPRGVEETVKCSTSLSSFSSTHVKKQAK